MYMIRLNKSFIILALLLILISNLTLFKEWAGINNNFYRYSNGDGTVTRLEIFYQGRNMSKEYPKDIFKLVNFTKNYPNSPDTILYRLFVMNPLHFWRWGEYVFSWRFRLPYKNWEEIRMRRKEGFQVHQYSLTEF